MKTSRTVELLSSQAESQLLWRLRLKIASTLARLAMQNARLQVLCVLVASAILWIGLFVLFHEGFQFVRAGLVHTGLRTQLVHVMFNIFFVTLTVMLLFSSAIILYGSLYRGEEVRHLLTTPIRSERIVAHKFHEAVFFSGWGFVLLASPMLLAYGAVFHAAWYYYVLLLPFVMAFVYIPATLGAVSCLIVVRLLPAVRIHALALLSVGLFAVGAYFAWQALAYQNRDMMSFSWFQDVMARLEFSEQRLLPSWWLSSGLLEATQRDNGEAGWPPWLESILFLAVLLSNALLLQLVLQRVAAAIFRKSYSRLQGIVPPKRRPRVWWLDRWIELACSFLPVSIRHMIVKDMRLFRRDPVQWSQSAIFFGLLVLYFLNVRRFDYAGVMEQWVTVMSFLNVAVVGLLLSTFTARFVFPAISLEGRRFWILATSPISRDAILWGKFWFACVGSWPVCALLVLISDLALGVGHRSLIVVTVHQLQCLLLCAGLAAMAVGLGAKLPNLRETSPARIASGFGGTLNLVLSSLFIVVLLLVTSVPTFAWAESAVSSRVVPEESSWMRDRLGLGSMFLMVCGISCGVVIGLIATIWPLRVGLRAFRRLEP